MLTLVALYLLYLIIPPLVDWAIISANWGPGTSRAACTKSGACWTMIRARFGLLMYGFYPLDQRWRVDLTFLLQFVAMAVLLIEKVPYKKQSAIFLFVIYPVIAFILLYGGFGLPVVETSQWGGLMLTLVLSTTGIVASLPIGILLALGRRSRSAGDAPALHQLHRVRTRRAADLGAVHGLGGASRCSCRRA